MLASIALTKAPDTGLLLDPRMSLVSIPNYCRTVAPHLPLWLPNTLCNLPFMFLSSIKKINKQNPGQSCRRTLKNPPKHFGSQLKHLSPPAARLYQTFSERRLAPQIAAEVEAATDVPTVPRQDGERSQVNAPNSSAPSPSSPSLPPCPPTAIHLSVCLCMCTSVHLLAKVLPSAAA